MNFDVLFLVIECVCIIFFLAAGIHLFRKRQSLINRLEAQSTQERVRELDHQLSNYQMIADEAGSGSSLRPYEERYTGKSQREKKNRSVPQIELVIVTPETERKYLTSLERPIRIGSDSDNELVISSRGISRRQCVLSAEGADIILHNLDTKRDMIIVRSLARRRISGKPIRLRSGDRICVSDVSIEITII